MTYTTRARRKSCPIPQSISFEMDFLPDDLSEDEYKKEVRKIVKRQVNQHKKPRWENPLIDFYDARISKIIEEVILEN